MDKPKCCGKEMIWVWYDWECLECGKILSDLMASVEVGVKAAWEMGLNK